MERISTKDFLDSCNLPQLQHVLEESGRRIDKISKGEKVRIWSVGRHCNEYHTLSLERAVVFAQILLESFIEDDSIELTLDYHWKYNDEVGEYVDNYVKENAKIDEYLKIKEEHGTL